MEDLLPFQLIKKYKFKTRPISLPSDLRPLYKIGQILLVLELGSRSSKASILKIQFFNWLFNYTDTFDINLQDIHVLHLDPSVNRAIEFALGEKLVLIENKGEIKLADKGSQFLDLILKDTEMYKREKEILGQLGKKLSESKISEIINRLI
jgi:hypothetical protein